MAEWWQDGIIYQVYPRSFADANGDGVGDLPGILARLDHLTTLGVDALWLSPIQPSPMADFGYDVADYRDIDPLFGTLVDLDRLVAACHARNLRLILDFVPNHSSDRHPWFAESRSAPASPRRDWYIWRDPAPDGGPPNNWLSHFGGPAWTRPTPTSPAPNSPAPGDPTSGQYYLHSFLPQQPDLNWRNPAVAQAMNDVLRFWLDRGVDGFRVDVMWLLVKDAGLRDNPANPDAPPDARPFARQVARHSADQPETHAAVAQMRRTLDAYPRRMLAGEIYLPVDRLVRYYGGNAGTPALDECHLPFNFQLLLADWTAETLARTIRTYEAALPAGAWPNWVLGNHDRPRIASRVGPHQARTAAMLLLTLRGTPTLYYGDELGLPDVPIPPDRERDPAGLREPGQGLGRDPVRTPMPWDASPHAGFGTAEPWLPLNPDHATRNVAALAADPRSILTLYRRLIALRRATPALVGGAIHDVHARDGVLHYTRTLGPTRLAIALNLTDQPREPGLPDGTVLLSTALDRHSGTAGLHLRASEGLVVAVA